MIFTPLRAFLALVADGLDPAPMITGFGLHGFHALFDFETAVTLHTMGALALAVLWVFAIFWHLTTGTWQHYVPTAEGLWQVARSMPSGSSRGNATPTTRRTGASIIRCRPSPTWGSSCFCSRHLGQRDRLPPLLHVAGHPGCPAWLQGVALVAHRAAFLILVFIIAHVYLLTTGHSFKEPCHAHDRRL